jgi:hypothetical protein
MKGQIEPDHMPVNKYELRVIGLADLAPLSISGIEEELQRVDLPDRTKASGGQRNPTEFDMTIPLHHTIAHAAMELWFKESSDPVLPTYKKPCTLVFPSISNNTSRLFMLQGVFPCKRALPELDKSNDGEMAMVTWTMSVDNIIPF